VGGEAKTVDPGAAMPQHPKARQLLLIQACESLDTSAIAIYTGSRNPESMWRYHPDNDSKEAWQDLHNTLEQVLPVAEAAGVTIAFEPEYNNVASNPRKSRKLIDEMGSPNLKVIMDAANIFGKDDLSRMKEVLDEAFELLGDHIAYAHGKDLDHGGDAGHLAAGTGKLDYAHYVSLLCALPFDVPVILHGLKEEQLDESVAMLRGHAAALEAGGKS
jgi:sugar phosphate isomerase/epimerase